jgi:hypothetical protein
MAQTDIDYSQDYSKMIVTTAQTVSIIETKTIKGASWEANGILTMSFKDETMPPAKFIIGSHAVKEAFKKVQTCLCYTLNK